MVPMISGGVAYNDFFMIENIINPNYAINLIYCIIRVK
jgi:hypothetical protein